MRVSTRLVNSSSAGAAVLALAFAIPEYAYPVELQLDRRHDLCSDVPAEPSGLALSRDRTSLWTVSDDSPLVFRIDTTGQPLECFDIGVKGLEGIAATPAEDALYAVSENENEIVRIDATTRKTSKRRLQDLDGWKLVEKDFEDGDKNKGLEGITVRPGTASAPPALFVLKEGEPRLLIELSLEPWKIVRRIELSGGAWGDSRKADVSGMDFDATRQAFWIVSDKQALLYLYDARTGEVDERIPLEHEAGRRIDKAEGVAVDPDSNRVYVVSDSERRLYVFAIR